MEGAILFLVSVENLGGRFGETDEDLVKDFFALPGVGPNSFILGENIKKFTNLNGWSFGGVPFFVKILPHLLEDIACFLDFLHVFECL